MQARHITVTGQVQGVGFRPFVYRLAKSIGLTGQVRNSAGIVSIKVQGLDWQLDQFEKQLISDAPPIAKPVLQTTQTTDPVDTLEFVIQKSDSGGVLDIHLPTDHFTCDECLNEITDPKQRRYRYPFINCTQCGPRYTIIHSLPYDRPNTSLNQFPLCDACLREYSNPLDRRFHAQPLACQECGPSLHYVDNTKRIEGNDPALQACIHALNRGLTVAIKGVGGYHLMCDALNAQAISRLRLRKQRPAKPLAVMFPLMGDDGMQGIRQYVVPNESEEKLLLDSSRPIVLVNKINNRLPQNIAPNLNEIGAFLPYSPLHHLLLNDLKHPLIATSGNVSGEPVLTDNEEAEERLCGIADAFLHHDRPIQRPADDSVIRVIDQQPGTIRLGRGKAPLELTLAKRIDSPVLAVGGHMKATIALAWDNRVVISPHISDLGSLRGQTVFSHVAADLQALYSKQAQRIICDAHSGYASHRWASRQDVPYTPVWHHHAHASALAGEHPEIKRWLAFTWDGVGLGEDSTLWGGEALYGSPANWQRLASFKPFFLPGGEKAGREPWRSAAALRWSVDEAWMPTIRQSNLALAAWKNKVNCPETSAAGRIFDAAACMILGTESVSYEGQAPMALEACVDPDCQDAIDIPLSLDNTGILRADWSVLIPALVDKRISVPRRAALFHNSMAQCLINQIQQLKLSHSFEAIGLSGGVFQNRVLTEKVMALGRLHQLNILLPKQIPTNDAGLSYGQIIESTGFSHD